MSKRVFHHPPASATGRKYWRSIGQLDDTPEFRQWVEREFPQGASELEGGQVSRRSFLQLMGASTALAGLSFAGCRRPEKHLVPFTRGVEWSIPGKQLFYASSRPTRNGYIPLIVGTYDGRPTKVDGNPRHPATKGASDAQTQASLLDLYDPDRIRHFVRNKKVVSSADFEKAIDELIANAGDGSGLAFLLEQNPSPTRERLRAEIEAKFPQALWAVYEPVSGNAAAKVSAGPYGAEIQAVPNIGAADVIVALDADFLGQEGDLTAVRQFAARRNPDGKEGMNRLYAVDNRFTVTSGIADHRLRVPVSQIGLVAKILAAELTGQTDAASVSALKAAVPGMTAATLEQWIKEAAADLKAHQGKSLVLAGARQPASVHVTVAQINASIGSSGATLNGRRTAAKPAASLTDLATALGQKTISTIIIVGGNPAYNAPFDLKFPALLGNAKTVIRAALGADETSALAQWQVPLAHYLESWGDGVAFDGSYVPVQPMILPLFGGWSELDILAKFAGRTKPEGPELIQETFKERIKPADFSNAWYAFLRDGFVADEVVKTEPVPAVAAPADANAQVAPPMPPEGFELVFVADSSVDDGRFANNPWLQEFPDPITKLTWDNAAYISPASAEKLSVDTGDVIEIELDGRFLEFPVLVLPGHADRSLTIPLGYGRKGAGRVGNVGESSESYVFGDKMMSGGVNAYPLVTTTAPYFAVGAKVRSVDRTYRLAITQEHGSLEGRGPDLLREGTLSQYQEDPGFVKTLGLDAHADWKEVNGKKTEINNRSLYAHPPLNDIHQWGMTVDLNSCTGCGACMVACQAENNIPVVGKRQVIDGREMHWIRMDRYFASADDREVDEPEMVSQPIMCQHCENAPCETVCPVNATVHSEDGLNVMAYNRCIGTRYCANNCPFKVRRFNFFDYNQRKLDQLRKWNLISEKGMPETLQMSKNPNVTVRMRGVMEKCTFCVQRIQEAKIATKVKARNSDQVRIPADSFTTACAQVCPTEAIVFGDIAQPESRVSKLRTKERGYRLLEYLNVEARVWYLARIRNPNLKMPDAARMAAYSRGHGHHHSASAANGAEATTGEHH